MPVLDYITVIFDENLPFRSLRTSKRYWLLWNISDDTLLTCLRHLAHTIRVPSTSKEIVIILHYTDFMNTVLACCTKVCTILNWII